MEKIDKLYEQLENFEMVRYRMDAEGLHYCFKHYSSFKRVEDEKFHSVSESYIKIADELEEYVKSKIIEIQNEIQEEL
jgi:hypothetical protein